MRPATMDYATQILFFFDTIGVFNSQLVSINFLVNSSLFESKAIQVLENPPYLLGLSCIGTTNNDTYLQQNDFGHLQEQQQPYLDVF